MTRGIDPSTVSTREELAATLTQLRVEAGLTVRQVVQRSAALHGTVSGWFAGNHLPTDANEPVFRAVLHACGITTAAAQQPWLEAVRRVRPTTGRRRAAEPEPYRGLQPFHAEDAAWFFGRDELIDHLDERVAQLRHQPGPRILFVLGASGAGKSSLLQAGLVSRLRQRGIDHALLAPGEQPQHTLAAATGELVVIDQFEESWSQCRDDSARHGFFQTLTAESDPSRRFVLGLRADFYGHAAAEPLLHRSLARTPVLVGPLDATAIRSVIVEPARKANWTVEEDLVQLILAQFAPTGSRAAVAHDAGALPLLQHALLATWRHARQRRMTVADYTAAGGLTGAVAQSAEDAYRALTDREHRLARLTFLRLIALDEERLTRRRVNRRELVFGADTAAELHTVLEQFVTHRLLTVDDNTVEITHEALVGAWPRLREWVDADRQGLLLHRQLTHATQVWLDSRRDTSAVLGPARLALVIDWMEANGRATELNQSERDYLAASTAHHRAVEIQERRRTRNLQRFAAALAAALVFAIVLAVIAVTLRSTAAHQRSIAEHTRDQALSRQVSLQATQLQDKDPALSAQLALAAYRIAPTVEATSALLDSTAVDTPVRLLGPQGQAYAATGADSPLVAIQHPDDSTDLGLLSPTGLTDVGRLPPASAEQGTGVLLAGHDRILARRTARTIELWDVSDPRRARRDATLPGPAATYRSFAVNPDATQLAAGTTGSEVRRWDIGDPAQPRPLPPVQLPAGDAMVAYSPDGRLLAAAGPAAALRVWNVDTPDGVPLADLPADGSAAQALAVRFSPDARTLAIGSRANDVERWDVSDPARPSRLPPLGGFTSYVDDVSYSPDGATLAATSSDNTIRLWAADNTDAPVMTLPDPVIPLDVRFSADGHTLVTTGLDGVVRLWPLPGPVLRGARSVAFQTPVDRTGTRLLVGTGAADSHPKLWNISDPDHPVEYAALGVGPGELTCGAVALSPDGNRAAVGSRTGHVYLWDTRDPRHPALVASVSAVHGLVGSLGFSPDGTVLVAAGQDDPVVTLWDTRDAAAPESLAAVDSGPGVPADVAVDRTGRLLAVATSDNVVRVWDIGDTRRPRPLPTLAGFRDDVTSVAFRREDETLAAASVDRTVRLFDLGAADKPRATTVLDGPADTLVSVNFSPDGHRVVAGGAGSGVWIWDVTDQAQPRQVAELQAYRGRINDAAYGRDGQILAAAGPDRVVRLWRTEPDRVAARLCASQSARLTPDEWQRYIPGTPPRPLCP